MMPQAPNTKPAMDKNAVVDRMASTGNLSEDDAHPSGNDYLQVLRGIYLLRKSTGFLGGG